MTETTHIIQSSDYVYGRWIPWTCCSPQYETLTEARAAYDSTVASLYFQKRIRLVTVRTNWEQVPGVRVHYNVGSRLTIHETKTLRCESKPTRADLVPVCL